jgi:hypothetical protein
VQSIKYCTSRFRAAFRLLLRRRRGLELLALLANRDGDDPRGLAPLLEALNRERGKVRNEPRPL